MTDESAQSPKSKPPPSTCHCGGFGGAHWHRCPDRPAPDAETPRSTSDAMREWAQDMWVNSATARHTAGVRDPDRSNESA